jgi:hypothetical protein
MSPSIDPHSNGPWSGGEVIAENCSNLRRRSPAVDRRADRRHAQLAIDEVRIPEEVIGSRRRAPAGVVIREGMNQVVVRIDGRVDRDGESVTAVTHQHIVHEQYRQRPGEHRHIGGKSNRILSRRSWNGLRSPESIVDDFDRFEHLSISHVHTAERCRPLEDAVAHDDRLER